MADTADLTGRASVIDGDTIEVHGQRIRLHGIDAPEGGQTCDDATGKPYRCGQVAALALADKIGTGTVSCEQRDVDRYGRIVAVCRLDDLDLNAWLVTEGLAIDYPPIQRRRLCRRAGASRGGPTLPWPRLPALLR